MMDGMIKVGGGGGGGKVGIEVVDDMGDGMQCNEHPYRNNPGGICAFCLQEKLGKLIVSSSSFPVPLRASPPSSSSPSFRSDVTSGIINIGGAVAPTGVGSANVNPGGGLTSTSSLSLALHRRPAPGGKARSEGGGGGYSRHYHQQEYQYSRRARIPFLLAKRKKKMITAAETAASSSASTFDRDIVFKRSKSTTTAPGRTTTGHFLDNSISYGDQEFSPRRRGFWSFLYLSSSFSSSSKSKPDNIKVPSFSPATTRGASNLSRRVGGDRDDDLMNVNHAVLAEDEEVDDVSPSSQATASASSFGRKVSRSRSVGCGSRSFSGDFFERISTGFGDCTLRRVESQREGKPKGGGSGTTTTGSHMKERVRCGGIFGGFIMTSSSSSSSSTSTSYWEMNGKPPAGGGPLSAHGGRPRSSWGWAFASPMRAFTKPAVSSKDGKRDHGNKNATPNLAAIPSLLAVRG